MEIKKLILLILINLTSYLAKNITENIKSINFSEQKSYNNSFIQSPGELKHESHRLRHQGHDHHHHHQNPIKNSKLIQKRLKFLPPPLLPPPFIQKFDFQNNQTEQLQNLTRIKRQYFEQQKPIYYVTEDGSDYNQAGNNDEWTNPSPCSRSCGGGVAYQDKICTSSSSSRGEGSVLSGEELVCENPPLKRFFSCNTQDCFSGGGGQETEDNFRAEQCSAFDNVPFEGRYYQWIPYTKAPNKCELNCMPQGERFYYRHKRKVIDGTKCDDENKHICVDGKCLPVGCDNVLGSRAREDKCRQCGGDGSNCHTVQGVFDTNNNLQVGYNDVLLIPQGATNILVKEKRASNNYLAIRNTSNHYYLNGNWRIDFPRELQFASTIFHYERKPHSFFAPESIRCLGPISESIYIVVLYQESNPGIEYEYSISDKENQISVDTDGSSYYWISEDYSECSVSCGGGRQQRRVTCAKRTEYNVEFVEDYLCDRTNKPNEVEHCNYTPCPLRWYTGEWEACSAKCGSNETGHQYRIVFCEQSVHGAVAIVDDERRCEVEIQEEKPSNQQECHGGEQICATWYTSPWGNCSRLCGDGEEKRVVKCHSKEGNKTNVYEDSKCTPTEDKPEESRPCYLKPCEGVDWITGPWSGCKASDDPCDDTMNPVESRQIYCSSAKGKVYSEEFCQSFRKPNSTRDCEQQENNNNTKSCEFAWFAMQWGECLLKTCLPVGDSPKTQGTRSRLVFCGTLTESGGVTKVDDEEKCNETKKYESEEPCDLDEEFIKTECHDKAYWFTGPWSKCSNKDCKSGGTRTRQVICMQGNESTTDVKKCGEEGIVFASEDCQGDCTTGDDTSGGSTVALDEMMMTTSVGGSTTEEIGGSSSSSEKMMTPIEGVDCEPDYEEEYYEYEDEQMSTTESIISSGSGDDETGSAEGEDATATTIMDEMSTSSSSGESGLDEMLDILGNATTGSDTLISSTTSSSENITSGSGSGSGDDLLISGSGDDDSSGSNTTDFTSSTTFISSSSSSSSISSDSTSPSVTTTTSDMSSPSSTSELTTESSTTLETSSTTTMESTTSESTTTETPTSTPTTTSMTSSESTTTTTEDMTTSQSTTSSSTTITDETVPTVDYASGTDPSEAGNADYDNLPSVPAKLNASDDSSGSGSGSGSGNDTFEPFPEDIESGSGEISGSGEMSGSGSGDMKLNESSTIEYESGSGELNDTSTISEMSGSGEMASGSGSGDDDNTTATTSSSAPRTTLEEALTAEQKLPKCPSNSKKSQKSVPNCEESDYGCCPDGKELATGPFGVGCSIPKTCEETKFGCCSDGSTPAQGKLKQRGCPIPDCKQSLFGCCPDGKTSAEGNDLLNCDKPCEESEHGCCPDGKTAKKGPKGKGCPKVKCGDTPYGCCPGDEGNIAEGPNFKGCKEINKDNCTANFFGCCLDGKTAALGSNDEGCPETPPCMSEEFGCCDDEITSAHGKNKEGCCLNTEFGCCPDNIVPASGHNLEGCTCASSPYGCCPDNTTTARGPDGECGCKFTEHGCCPDGYTIANGTNNEGCPCSTFQFGCCPDGISIAKGPNKEGCGCEYSEHGCCPDRKTPAQKPNDSCGCESSWFGCCPDGKTEAKGEEFEGCEEIPIKPGDVCGLDKERGSCRNFTVKWFFDMEYGGCSRFWYGGCDGNQNRFGSQDECKSVCVEPEGRDACYLPQVSGPCEGYYPSWYYDPQREMCLQFIYGGCLGNNNRFATRELCENNCLLPDRVDACDQPKTEGPCKGNYTRFYYDKTDETCKSHQYGGCKGNNNNFLTERECEQRCSQEGRMRAILEQCTKRPPLLLQQSVSNSSVSANCKGDLTRWYYEEQVGTCLKFNYGGCGNSYSNRFVSRAECINVCGKAFNNVLLDQQSLNSNLQQRNSCFLPRHEGPCGEKLARWYYDTNEQRCVPFYYGGCQGNSNRFTTLGECEKTCPAALLAENTCLLPPTPGDCTVYTERYYYDPYEGRCKAFVYNGCGGNSNNFMVIDECRNKCERSYVPQPVITTPNEFNTAHCFHQPPDSSSCYSTDPSNTLVKWFYDSRDGVCKQFRWYSNCQQQQQQQQQQNQFDNRQECEDRCGQAQDTCSLPQVQGPCSGSFQQFYYDVESDSCQLFEYGGCQGNGNRFDTLVQCEQRCKKSTQESPQQQHRYDHDQDQHERDREVDRPDDDNRDSDRERQEEEERRRQQYYEEEERRRQEYERQRQQQQEEEEEEIGQPDQSEILVDVTTIAPYIDQDDICKMAMEIGPCRASVPSFYYDSRTRKCQAFIYGGCQGNANRFETEEMCERQCGVFRGEDICSIEQADPGPCRARIVKYYFNNAERSCQQFYYGGCQGNGNRFSTKEECESVCHAKTEIVTANDTISGAAICRLPVEIGPCVDGYKRWYYDFEQNTCIPFVFGGCAGNLNRFKSFDSCLGYCQKALQFNYRQQNNHFNNNNGHKSSRAVVPNEQHVQQQQQQQSYEDVSNVELDELVNPCSDQLLYCETLKCPYGIDKQEILGNCPNCECIDPCRDYECPTPDTQCTVDILNAPPPNTYQHQDNNKSPHFRPVCRKTNKPGECPNLSTPSRIGICAQECQTDAECTSDLKCCFNGCGSSCLLPQISPPLPEQYPPPNRVAPPPQYNNYDPNQQPARILSSNTEIEAEEGSLASLECLSRGNPSPIVIWKFNNVEVSVESGRFRSLQDGSILQIIGVYKRDEGVYTCVADNGIGRPATLNINLIVTEPTARQASIVDQNTEPNMIVSLGASASLRCFAMGWPRPSVTWWRGERMLPFSSERYEQLRDYSLLIRLVSLRDLGPYTCQAYNGQGKAASWTITVQALGPVASSNNEDREYLQYVISSGRRPPIYVGQNFTRTTTTTTTTTQSPYRYNIPTTTTTQRVIIPNYLVPLRTSIKLDRTIYPVGHDIVIPCEVEGYPHPTVHWYQDDIPIKPPELNNKRIFNNELRITNSSTQDSGVYRCDAVNEYGSSSSSVTIVVEGVYLHPNCTDNPFFANCKLIVKANYCTNKYYARFCCKSCTLAGQLPPFGPHLQEYGQAYFRRGQVEYASSLNNQHNNQVIS